MKPLAANQSMAGRGERIARGWCLEPNLPAPHRAPAAGVDSLPASAAFSHSPWGQGDTAPAENPKPTPAASAVTLSAHAMILLRAIAAYEQVDDATAITLALATHATKIGAGPLARACLDEIERTRSLAGDDLHAVPEFRRVGETRFRSGGP